jgi:hypothetical protein
MYEEFFLALQQAISHVFHNKISYLPSFIFVFSTLHGISVITLC